VHATACARKLMCYRLMCYRLRLYVGGFGIFRRVRLWM